jgi:hypothetical protein
VKTVFKNDIISLVKIKIYSNLNFLRKEKNQENIVKRLEQIWSRLVKKLFENDIVSLVKIQIYLNSIF